MISLYEMDTWIRTSKAKNPSQAITCVRKDGNFKEWGTAPTDNMCALSYGQEQKGSGQRRGIIELFL